MRRFVYLIAIVAVLAGSCTDSDEAPVTTPPPVTTGPPTTTAPPPPTAASSTLPPTSTTGPPPTTTTTAAPAPSPFTAAPRLAAFADFEAVPLLGADQTYAGPPLPDALDGVLVAPVLERVVEDPDLAAALLADGFVLVPDRILQFHHAYEWPGYEDQIPLFVTTDAALHTWHLAFSKALRTTEQEVLLPKLDELVLGLLEAARLQEIELVGTELEEDAGRAVQYYQAVGSLLGLDVGPLGPLATREVELAREALQMTGSPITTFGAVDIMASPDQAVDYSQFRPRGHYTRTPDLERYFRGMAMLGQAAFFLSSERSLRLGVLAARPLVGSSDLTDLWEDIYEPTAFLVGTADDFTPFELLAAVEDAAPGATDDPTALTAPGAMAAVRSALAATRSVAINPEAASVRIMGARFVLDSFILDQLAWPNVGEPPPELRRVRVSPLDVAAAFGSAFAYDIQDRAGETAYRNYESQMEKMRALVAARVGDDWAGTVYDAWLYALQPLWLDYGDQFPEFMRTPAWEAKAHQTGFGSYTELKHDTVLYAKQGFAAEAGGEPRTFVPRHWVEPDPVTFRRLAAVVRLTRDGLGDRNLLTAEMAQLLDEVEAMASRLGRIAADELGGRPLSAEDNAWLEAIGPLLEWLWLASTDVGPDVEFPDALDDRAALVADVFRTSFDVLELGTGHVDLIYVLVPNDAGTFQLAVGGVYSYYEFWRPADQGRLTDEEWHALLDDGSQPDRPGWLAAVYGSG